MAKGKSKSAGKAKQTSITDVAMPLLILSDLNMHIEFLAHLVMAAVNKKAFQPSLKAIKDKYYAMFRGQSSDEAE